MERTKRSPGLVVWVEARKPLCVVAGESVHILDATQIIQEL